MHGREIFRTGEYIQYFSPDDKWNPFSRIYARKKQDTIKIINASKEPKTILDLGGGMGRLALALARSAENKVILADISMDMLRLAAKQEDPSDDVTPVNADAHQLPFRDKSLDRVVGLDLFCHLEEPKRALREFFRVLSDEGILILDSTNSNPLWALFYPRYLGKNPFTWTHVLRSHGHLPGWEKIVKHYPKKNFFSLLHEAGFSVLQNVDYGPVVCPKWHLAVCKKIL